MAPGGRSIYVAPDGGWGWVVVFGAFVLQALTVGSAFTFGVLYVELLDVFGQPEGVTAWIGSIQTSLLYLTGSLSTIIISTFIHQNKKIFVYLRWGCTESRIQPNITNKKSCISMMGLH